MANCQIIRLMKWMVKEIKFVKKLENIFLGLKLEWAKIRYNFINFFFILVG